MEEKKGKNVGLIISCIVNVILIGIIVAGVIFYEKGITEKKPTNDVVKSASRETTTEENVVNTEQEKPEVQEAGETATQKSNKIDESKDWVYVVKTDKRIEGIEEEEYIEYPQINYNTDNIKELNNKIKTFVLNNPFSNETKYYLNNNIISLVFTCYTEGDSYYIYIFNIDSTNGNILTNEELLSKMGITEDLHEKINKAVWKVVDEHVAEDEDAYSHGTSININDSFGPQIHMPLFINGNGKLSTVVEYVVPSGSGGPWGIITEVE